MKAQRISITLLILCLLVVNDSSAQLAGLGGIIGGGVPVFDGVANAQLYTEIEKMILQLSNMYEQLMTQKEHLAEYYHQSRYLPQRLLAYGMSQSRPWTYPVYGNTSGKVDAWVRGVTNSSAVAAAYASMVTHVPVVNADVIQNWSAPVRNDYMRDVGRIEIMDGQNKNAMATVADVLSVQEDRAGSLKKLKADALASDDAHNTTAAQMNIANAAHVLQLEQQMDAQKLEVVREQRAAFDAMLQREQAAQRMNEHVEMLQNYDKMSKVFAGSGTSINRYKGF